MTTRLKGIVQPSHKAQRPGTAGTPRSAFRPGRRYPIGIANAITLEEKLKSYLQAGELVDLSRLTRCVSPSEWIVWTTTGRRIEVTAMNGVIEDAIISDGPDPELPPRAR